MRNDQKDPSTEAMGATAPLLLTAGQVAHLLQIGERTLWRLASSGGVIPPVRIGGATRWRRDAVEEWIAAGCPPSSPERTERSGGWR